MLLGYPQLPGRSGCRAGQGTSHAARQACPAQCVHVCFGHIADSDESRTHGMPFDCIDAHTHCLGKAMLIRLKLVDQLGHGAMLDVASTVVTHSAAD
jgi:hypothetical protein